MNEKYRIHAWADIRLDEALDPERARQLLIRALHNLNDLSVEVLCEGPMREDTSR